jgi:chromosomal replication initiator protein
MAEVDLPYAQEALKGLIEDPECAVSSETVLRAVASFYSLKPAQLKAKNNSRPIAVPRQIAMYVCKALTNQSLLQIGKDIGGKHHTTVLHSIRKIDSLRKKDPEISAAVNKIMKSLK